MHKQVSHQKCRQYNYVGYIQWTNIFTGPKKKWHKQSKEDRNISQRTQNFILDEHFKNSAHCGGKSLRGSGAAHKGYGYELLSEVHCMCSTPLGPGPRAYTGSMPVSVFFGCVLRRAAVCTKGALRHKWHVFTQCLLTMGVDNFSTSDSTEIEAFYILICFWSLLARQIQHHTSIHQYLAGEVWFEVCNLYCLSWLVGKNEKWLLDVQQPL